MCGSCGRIVRQAIFNPPLRRGIDGLGPALRVGRDEGVKLAGAYDHRLGEALPVYPKNLRPDLDLLNASDNLEKSQIVLERLHDKYGDDADNRDEYAATDARRDEAVGVLKSKRVKTTNGMIAKARALAKALLRGAGDGHTCSPMDEEVAASLAHDLLRYFGAAAARA
jgi:hypothetical protein